MKFIISSTETVLALTKNLVSVANSCVIPEDKKIDVKTMKNFTDSPGYTGSRLLDPTLELASLASFILFVDFYHKTKKVEVFKYISNNLNASLFPHLCFAVFQIGVASAFFVNMSQRLVPMMKLSQELCPPSLTVDDRFLQVVYSHALIDSSLSSDDRVIDEFMSLEKFESWRDVLVSYKEKENLEDTLKSSLPPTHLTVKI